MGVHFLLISVALLCAIVKRLKGYIKLRIALRTLHGALLDATSEELQAYDDECAICKEPMAKAKKLCCSHLFHLVCLRSWLDQGLNENYSCPTCRKPFFASRPENRVTPHATVFSTDELLARQISDQIFLLMHSGVISNPLQNAESGDWRRRGDSSWLNSEGAGPSGLGRVQMVIRQLAAVGETYAQTSLEDTSWSLFPTNPSQTGTFRSAIAPGSVMHPSGSGGLRVRSTSQPANDNLANILSLAETVREVLPRIPDDIIFQDLQRNLLQM